MKVLQSLTLALLASTGIAFGLGNVDVTTDVGAITTRTGMDAGGDIYQTGDLNKSVRGDVIENGPISTTVAGDTTVKKSKRVTTKTELTNNYSKTFKFDVNIEQKFESTTLEKGGRVGDIDFTVR